MTINNPTYNDPTNYPIPATTTLELCANVRYDPTYQNVFDFDSAAYQHSWFSRKTVMTLTGNTFQRTENGFRCNINREVLEAAGVNYLIYNNVRTLPNNTSVSKYYYCFVVNLLYINENLTEIVFTIDYFNTYFFDFVLLNSFVEREMINVADDEPGANIVAESIGYGDYIMQRISSADDKEVFKSTDYKCVVACSFDRQFHPVAGDSSTAGAYNLYGIASGLCYLVFDSIEHGNPNSLSAWLVNCVAQNKINGVQCAFMIPSLFIPSGDINNGEIEKTPVGTDAEHSTMFRGTVYYNKPVMIDGYTPTNKKLLTYPYNMLYLTNNNASSKVYKWEYFDTPLNPDVVYFGLFGSGVLPPEVAMVPRDYNNGQKGFNMWERLVMQDFPMCSFSVDAFSAYIAANKWKLGFEAVQGIAQVATAIPGIVGGALNLGGAIGAGIKGAIAGGRAAKNQWSRFADYGLYGPGMEHGAPSKREILQWSARWGKKSFDDYMGSAPSISFGKAASGLTSLAGISASLLDIASLPPSASGQTTNVLNMGTNLAGFAAYQCCIREEYASIIDSYFDMFGYACHEVKQPTTQNRKYWNYIKTLHCLVRPTTGAHELPLDAQIAIQSIYDNGVTIWHYKDGTGNVEENFGDYSLDNHQAY